MSNPDDSLDRNEGTGLSPSCRPETTQLSDKKQLSLSKEIGKLAKQVDSMEVQRKGDKQARSVDQRQPKPRKRKVKVELDTQSIE